MADFRSLKACIYRSKNSESERSILNGMCRDRAVMDMECYAIAHPFQNPLQTRSTSRRLRSIAASCDRWVSKDLQSIDDFQPIIFRSIRGAKHLAELDFNYTVASFLLLLTGRRTSRIVLGRTPTSRDSASSGISLTVSESK